jgi:hypothetical protein
MNNIGFGIFCFGDDFYFRGADEKISKIISDDFHCYVLTDNPDYFKKKYAPNVLHTILYDKSFKSYHDKLILPRHILKHHDYCVLLDADVHVTNYSFLNTFKTYDFKYGISYVDTLLNHPAKREFVKDLITDTPEWNSYKVYAEKIYPPFANAETIWEYLLIINKIGFQQDSFYKAYEKLQVAKGFSDLFINKDINGAGEGVSLSIAAKLSNTDIQRDSDLYEIVKDSMQSVSRRFTNPEFWPDWMR